MQRGEEKARKGKRERTRETESTPRMMAMNCRHKAPRMVHRGRVAKKTAHRSKIEEQEEQEEANRRANR
jgi:hypothetical protein